MKSFFCPTISTLRETLNTVHKKVLQDYAA